MRRTPAAAELPNVAGWPGSDFTRGAGGRSPAVGRIALAAVAAVWTLVATDPFCHHFAGCLLVNDGHIG
jgi:hypothetical protein